MIGSVTGGAGILRVELLQAHTLDCVSSLKNTGRT